jgi:pimeloyl-ACP methyl ester carboxylesterase
MTITRRQFLAAALVAAASAKGQKLASGQLTLRTADARDSKVTIWRAGGRRRGLILFSHGAASAPWKYERLIGRWARAGFEVRAPLHVDSTDHPDTKRYEGFASWAARIHDMRALAASVHDAHYVAAGHSYGALVALTLGGVQSQQPEGITGSLRNSRVNAVIALSPPGPVPRLIDEAGYATLAVPALMQTGDKDVPPGQSSDSWRSHLASFEAAAAGSDRYSLVLEGVDHYFGGLICRETVPGPPQPQQLEHTIELTTLFLRAYGLGAARARRALDRRLTVGGPIALTKK